LNLRNALVLLAAGTTLAGCNTLNSVGGGSGGPAASLDSSTVLSAYTRTFANGSNTAFGAAQSAGGLGGISVATGSGTSSATTAKAAWLAGKVGISEDGQKATFTVGGHTYTLQYYGTTSGSGAFAGIPTRVYSDAGSTSAKGNVLEVFDGGGFMGALLLNNAQIDFDPDGDQLTGVTFELGGVETQVGNLPTQVATYTGKWQINSFPVVYDPAHTGVIANQADGALTATADFSNHTLEITGKDDDASVVDHKVIVSGTGTITGSQFDGNVDFSNGASGSGTFAGAFYGQNADQIGGVINGTGAVNGESGPVIGAFVGNKDP
jgi:hypothetical protein